MLEIPVLVTSAWTAIQQVLPIIAAIKTKFEPKAAAKEALEELLKAPEDADVQGAFRLQLKKLLLEDASFATDLGRLLEIEATLCFDPEFHFLPKDETLDFIHIPAGKFSMGSDPRKDEYAREEEQPQHELELPAFWLAKYPVTVAQFWAFVDASGYKPEYDRSLHGQANHPVVYITWYDALAYTGWLDQQMKLLAKEHVSKKNTALFWQGLVSGKLQVTLPSEAEWEKAARGSDGRIYPWGDDFDPNKANTDETGLDGTSAVGAYLGGKSPYGLLDMSGNVWEWTRTIWDDSFKYPYKMNDGREDLRQKDAPRVVRGGAFHYNRVGARCACRYRYNPNLWNDYLGFRVVVSPALLS